MLMISMKCCRKSQKLVPKFLWKIYDRLSVGQDENMSPLHLRKKSLDGEMEISDEHARIIEMSDTIMTFLNNRK